MLDLLNGGTLDSPGGSPRHRVEAQAGITRQGIGARLTANWQSGTHVDGGTLPQNQLSFSDLATVDFRLFANLGLQRALVDKWPGLRGVRVGVVVDNLFDRRMRVTDGNGQVPLSYQGAYLDPMGRSIRLTLRKLFLPPRPVR
jgi:outer membrane receptor protein involved in Fe transport